MKCKRCSGKSTLLNVISGSDTYEDGEMIIEGNPTSYFDEGDWEEYRRDYIGFVYQNYQLIESYTVFENVNAALLRRYNNDFLYRYIYYGTYYEFEYKQL